MTAKGKSIVSKGKTVKEAVSIALDLLSEKLDDVEIEIIENESKGIWGLRSKPAVVKLTLKETGVAIGEDTKAPVNYDEVEKIVQSLEIQAENDASPFFDGKKPFKPELSDFSGKVWVKDGKIYCKDAPEQYPLVSLGKGVKLFKNDEPVEQTFVVYQSDVLKVELEDEVIEPQWHLKLSPDKMEAVLKVIPGMHIYRSLKDKAPSTFLELEIEEKKVPIFIESGSVLEKLGESGVVYGVDYTEIARACTSEEPGSFIIAKGTSPTPGINGCFFPLREVEIKKGLVERPDGRVDYREIQQFPSVEHGQVLGVIKPPIPGIPGKTVTNEPVLPPEVLPVVVQPGKGIVLVENETKVIAVDDGHPDIKVKGMLVKISVIPKLLIGKNVDLQVGNVHYSGDVEVIGSVQDGMLVEAQGNILIHENVNMANVSAGSSMIVMNNIITSEVTAGKSSLLIAEIHQKTGELFHQIRHMEAAIRQLSTVSAFKISSFTQTGLGPLIKILCDGKFKQFPALAISLIDSINSGSDMLDQEWKDFGDRLYKGFILTHSSDFRSVEDVVQMAKTAQELYEKNRDDQYDPDCFIKAAFAHNSKLYSSGDITITGQGVYNSKLRAGGRIEIDGFVRGGEIYAFKGVKIGEAGTKGGMNTKIIVPKGETIQIINAMEETVIQIGSITHKFTVQSSNVLARLDDNGLLNIS